MPNRPLDRMPINSIIMWYGMSGDIPFGWRICDGNGDTPNLVGRFVRAVGSDQDNGKGGGRDEITLEEENLPAHSHLLAKKIYAWYRSFKGDNGDVWPLTDSGGLSKGEVYMEKTREAGSGSAFSIVPSYVGLYYIMKFKD